MFKVALFQILHPDTYHYEGHVDQKKKEFTDSVHKWNLWCNPNPNPSHSLVRTNVLLKQGVPNIEVFKSLLVWIFAGFPRWIKKLRVLRATPSPTEVQRFDTTIWCLHTSAGQHGATSTWAQRSSYWLSCVSIQWGSSWTWLMMALECGSHDTNPPAPSPVTNLCEYREAQWQYADDAVSYLFVWHRLIWFQGCSGGQLLKRAS